MKATEKAELYPRHAYDWNKAGKLKLAVYWGHLQNVPAVVPA